MNKVTRRSFVASVGIAAALPAAALLTTGVTCQRPARPSPPDATSRYLFFDPDESRFIESACERLIPHDDSGPGALEAGVAMYLDRQLAGPWGSGRQLYRTGPWQPGTFASGPQSSSPAATFRTALSAINRAFERRGCTFSDLEEPVQADYLRRLAAGSATLDGVPAAMFFDLLLTMTVEGYFSGPVHTHHRGMIAWPLRGFPGSYFRESGRGARKPAATSQSQR